MEKKVLTPVYKGWSRKLNSNILFEKGKLRKAAIVLKTRNIIVNYSITPLKNIKRVDETTTAWFVECINSKTVLDHPNAAKQQLKKAKSVKFVSEEVVKTDHNDLLHLISEKEFPRDMLVWDNFIGNAVIDKVLAIVPERESEYKIICSSSTHKNAEELVNKQSYSFEEVELLLSQFICEECPNYPSKGNVGTFIHYWNVVQQKKTLK